MTACYFIVYSKFVLPYTEDSFIYKYYVNAFLKTNTVLFCFVFLTRNSLEIFKFSRYQK